MATRKVKISGHQFEGKTLEDFILTTEWTDEELTAEYGSNWQPLTKVEQKVEDDKVKVEQKAQKFEEVESQTQTKFQTEYFEYDSNKFSISEKSHVRWLEIGLMQQFDLYPKSMVINTLDKGEYTLQRSEVKAFLKAYMIKRLTIDRLEKKELKKIK